MTEAHSPNVDYSYRIEGIHLLTIYGGTRETIDLVFGHLERITEETPLGTLIPIMMDSTNAKTMPPVGYLIRRSREFQRKFPDPPTTRFAIVHNTSMWIPIIQGFADMSAQYNRGRNKIRFFKLDQREDAVSWLMNETKTHQP